MGLFLPVWGAESVARVAPPSGGERRARLGWGGSSGKGAPSAEPRSRILPGVLWLRLKTVEGSRGAALAFRCLALHTTAPPGPRHSPRCPLGASLTCYICRSADDPLPGRVIWGGIRPESNATALFPIRRHSRSGSARSAWSPAACPIIQVVVQNRETPALQGAVDDELGHLQRLRSSRGCWRPGSWRSTPAPLLEADRCDAWPGQALVVRTMPT